MSSIYHDLISREYDMNRRNNSTKLVNNILSSKYLIEKYELKGLLKGHEGCVNTVLFSEDGSHIFTGSDDTKVKIYCTETYKLIKTYDTIHTNNIFYAKDLPGTDMSIMVTCAADGRVVLTNLNTNDAIRIYRHRGRAHRIGLVPGEGNQFYTCGEDGVCCLFDLRDRSTSTLSSDDAENNNDSNINKNFDYSNESTYNPVLKTHFLNDKDKKCSIYTVGVNPMNPYELALGGSYSHVALYDSRKISTPFSYLCPEKLINSSAHITGLKFDYTGKMIIASYNDEDIYSFYTKEHAISNKRKRTRSSEVSMLSEVNNIVESMNQIDAVIPPVVVNRSRTNTNDSATNMSCTPSSSNGSYYRSYKGHRNNNTVKQVAFLGARSDYIVSGSDCGHIFIWDVHTSVPIQMLHGDKAGAINCLAAHPTLPILATSGLEDDAKVWAPTGEYDPILDGTPKKKNMNNIIEHNQQRNSNAFANSSTYSNSIMDMLMMLLHQGNVPLHSLSSDEEEDDDDDDGDDSTNHPITNLSGTRERVVPRVPRIAPVSRGRLSWTHLSRIIPVVLGRRRRSMSDEVIGDSSDEYDAQERMENEYTNSTTNHDGNHASDEDNNKDASESDDHSNNDDSHDSDDDDDDSENYSNNLSGEDCHSDRNADDDDNYNDVDSGDGYEDIDDVY